VLPDYTPAYHHINYVLLSLSGAALKRRELVRKLRAAGYQLDRTGDHAIYEKPGRRPVQDPNHREINEFTAQAIMKAAGITE
jgi:predicted RNA binding protein YcfA (HicA-like mRNA interferase family)